MTILTRKGGIGDILPLDRRLLMGDPKPLRNQPAWEPVGRGDRARGSLGQRIHADGAEVSGMFSKRIGGN